MIMEFEVLSKKKIVNNKIDLLSNYLQIDYDKVIIQDWVIIDDNTTMSLDLLCLAAYGNQDYVDLVMKFNRLSNVLELGIGQILAFPEIQSLVANSRYVDLSKTSNDTQSQTSILTIPSDPTSKPIPSSNFVQLKGNFVF